MPELYLHSTRAVAFSKLQNIVADLTETEIRIKDKACVYASGSFGRLEAGPKSDLDLFIIVDIENAAETAKPGKPLLDGLSEIKLKYDLITVVEKNGLPPFDGGGRFLTSHLIGSYTEILGSQEDDYRNTLTGRMLMLLESKPLLGEAIYNKAIELAVAAYFRDYENNKNNFVPSFLFNDILRMWRTFCVNYEFYRKEGDSRDKIKALKLKFSRMLTCYSGVIYLLAVYAKQNTLHPEDVHSMVKISPTERLEAIAADPFWSAAAVPAGLVAAVTTALKGYSEFLELSHNPKAGAEYKKDEEGWRERSYVFGQQLFAMIEILGLISNQASRLRKLITI